MPFAPLARVDDDAATVASEGSSADWGRSVKVVSGKAAAPRELVPAEVLAGLFELPAAYSRSET